MRDLETWETQTDTGEYWSDGSVETFDVDGDAIFDNGVEIDVETYDALEDVPITAPADWGADTEPIETVPASERAQELGARLTARAAAFGVTLPKDMADRAGQIMAGEEVAAPLGTPEIADDAAEDDQPVMEPEPDAAAEVVLQDDAAEDQPEPDSAETPEVKEEVQTPEAIEPPAIEADDGDLRLRVGARLGVLWAENGVSMQELAEASGVEPSDLVSLFNNGHPDATTVLIPVMRALGIEPTTGVQMIDGYLDEVKRQQADEK